ncbi:MAG: hypothetical protein CMH52_09115 [Myxococcales bacterium]|nr:hypothetical protein [Myxococcales bacterium]|tara:strand:- start:544 stop:1377 length:834 start_codon:yes stop_codon:yes gene_type:complete
MSHPSKAIFEDAEPIDYNNQAWADIDASLDPLRDKLVNHSLYSRLNTPKAVRIFMEHHCYSVVDFMCLLKSLQVRLTVMSVPWFPPMNRDAARFINEIVVEEESDESPDGGFISHYELYLDAMERAGADTAAVRAFIELVRNKQHYRRALRHAKVPAAAQRFVKATMEVCLVGKNHEVASFFVFGRENLIPDMFPEILKNLGESNKGLDLSRLVYYVDRHIELDGGEHGPAARNMLFHLCDNDPRRWKQVAKAATTALQERIRFWDSIEKLIIATER